MSTKWSHPPCLIRSLEWTGWLVQCRLKHWKDPSIIVVVSILSFLKHSLQKLPCASGTHFETHTSISELYHLRGNLRPTRRIIQFLVLWLFSSSWIKTNQNGWVTYSMSPNHQCYYPINQSFLPLETNLLAEMWKTQKHARLYCSGMGCIQILSNSPSKWCQHAVPPSEAAMNQRCPTRKTWHEKVPAILLGKIMENQRVTVLPLNSIIATNTTTG